MSISESFSGGGPERKGSSGSNENKDSGSSPDIKGSYEDIKDGGEEKGWDEELESLPSIGEKRAQSLYNSLGVKNLDDLKEYVGAGRDLEDANNIGSALAQKIKSGLETHTIYGTAEEENFAEKISDDDLKKRMEEFFSDEGFDLEVTLKEGGIKITGEDYEEYFNKEQKESYINALHKIAPREEVMRAFMEGLKVIIEKDVESSESYSKIMLKEYQKGLNKELELEKTRLKIDESKRLVKEKFKIEDKEIKSFFGELFSGADDSTESGSEKIIKGAPYAFGGAGVIVGLFGKETAKRWWKKKNKVLGDLKKVIGSIEV